MSGVDERYRKREQTLGPERLIVNCVYSESEVVGTMSCGHVDLVKISMSALGVLRPIRGNWRMRCSRCAGQQIDSRPDSKSRDWFANGAESKEG